MRTVLTSGTVTDKVAALTLQVQESPIHSLSSLDMLLSMVKKKGKREALLALGTNRSFQMLLIVQIDFEMIWLDIASIHYLFAGTVKDLFLSDLLLSGKKLKTFEQVWFWSSVSRRKFSLMLCCSWKLHRPSVSLFQHPLGKVESLASGNKDSLYKRLVIWYYEAQLKDRFAQFVKAVEASVVLKRKCTMWLLNLW